MKKRNLIIISALLTILIVLIALYHEQRVPILGYHAFYKYKSELKEDNPNIDNNIFTAFTNVNTDCVIGYIKDGEKYSFLDEYDKK